MKIKEGTPYPKRGEIWKKKDQGKMVEVTKVQHEKACIRPLKGRRSHSVTFDDMRRFWVKIT